MTGSIDEAGARGTTAASFIEMMLDDYVRRQRMEAFGGGDPEVLMSLIGMSSIEWDVTLSDESSDE